jgi:hypothetical protein
VSTDPSSPPLVMTATSPASTAAARIAASTYPADGVAVQVLEFLVRQVGYA